MRESVANVPVAVNSGPGELLGGLRGTPRLISVIARVANQLWPQKTAAELALRAAVSRRQAEEWLAARGGPSGDALARLITTDAGFAVLSELMDALPAGERPAWWRGFRRQAQLAEVRRLQDEARRRLEALEREEIV